MIQICIFPNCNRDTGEYDVIEPENSTLHVSPPKKEKKTDLSSENLYCFSASLSLTKNDLGSEKVRKPNEATNVVIFLSICITFLYSCGMVGCEADVSSGSPFARANWGTDRTEKYGKIMFWAV